MELLELFCFFVCSLSLFSILLLVSNPGACGAFK